MLKIIGSQSIPSIHSTSLIKHEMHRVLGKDISQHTPCYDIHKIMFSTWRQGKINVSVVYQCC